MNDDKIEKIEAVKCAACGTLHNIKADTFLSFQGNVCVGMCGGIIGDNFDDDGKLRRVTVYCRKTKCLGESLLKYIEVE